jgi:hypothetical protein
LFFFSSLPQKADESHIHSAHHQFFNPKKRGEKTGKRKKEKKMGVRKREKKKKKKREREREREIFFSRQKEILCSSTKTNNFYTVCIKKTIWAAHTHTHTTLCAAVK